MPSGTIDVTLPEAPVAPGASWAGTYGANDEAKLLYTLRGVARVGKGAGARRVALIALSQPDPSGVFRLTPGGLFALDLADGRWLRTRAGFSVAGGPRALRASLRARCQHSARRGRRSGARECSE